MDEGILRTFMIAHCLRLLKKLYVVFSVDDK